MSHYSVTLWKFSTLLLLTTLLPGCRMCDYRTRGHESISASVGRRRLADFHQGLKACLHTTRRHHIILPFSITRDVSYPHAVQICLRTQWQRGSRGWFWGTLHILWTAVVLWILVGVRFVGGCRERILVALRRLGCVTSVLMIKLTSSRRTPRKIAEHP